SGSAFAAPPGKSLHGRGMAADLGPPSQYGWIAANARRFGLDAGTRQGEPWHVQLGGTLGLGDTWTEQKLALGQTLAKGIITGANAALLGGSRTTSPSGGTSGLSSPSGPTSGTVPLDTVEKALYTAGFRGKDLVAMAAIPSRESQYRADAKNINDATKDA